MMNDVADTLSYEELLAHADRLAELIEATDEAFLLELAGLEQSGQWRRNRSESFEQWVADRYKMLPATAAKNVAAARAFVERRSNPSGGVDDAHSPTSEAESRDGGGRTLGITYRRADEEARTKRNISHEVEASTVDRANRAHAQVQNALANALKTVGLEPRSPKCDEPSYDLAWESGDTTYVAEAKGLTDENETKQLRLGIGQVLWFRNAMTTSTLQPNAVLAVERQPADRRWIDVCRDVGIELLWPETFLTFALRVVAATHGSNTAAHILRASQL
jgi:hypothetical protein